MYMYIDSSVSLVLHVHDMYPHTHSTKGRSLTDLNLGIITHFLDNIYTRQYCWEGSCGNSSLMLLVVGSCLAIKVFIGKLPAA